MLLLTRKLVISLVLTQLKKLAVKTLTIIIGIAKVFFRQAFLKRAFAILFYRQNFLLYGSQCITK